MNYNYNTWQNPFFNSMYMRNTNTRPYSGTCGGMTLPQTQTSTSGTPALPTGTPSGPTYSTPLPVESDFDIVPQTVESIQYTQGYLKTQIGRKVKVEFLIGTNMLVDREGTLVEVGISYIIIREAETDDLVLCDMYSIKFVKFFY